ncbi:MAG TPA: hypothetical protein VFT28_12255 [Gemmatimonadales bacterium]|nr:hypothetical protein [Gemmatimonadales bacterium]
MLTFAARTRLMLWPAALALLAIIVTSVGLLSGWAGTLAWGVTFSLGLPFVLAAETVAGWLGPARGAWILPVSIPLGLLPYLAADLLVRRLARRREDRSARA